MKILICCPGSWTHGLDSPERGEGRWAQNLARFLGSTGKYKVYAASAGDLKRGSGRPYPGVKLIKGEQAHKYGPFDMYFDSSWWQGKKPLAKASKYFYVIWSLENRFRDPNFPKDHYITYPYYTYKNKFIGDFNPNSDRTFFLPTPFCKELAPPAFDRNEILWPARSNGAQYRERNAHLTVEVLEELRSDLEGFKINWMFANELNDKGIVKKGQHKEDGYLDLSPYNKIINTIKRCKLSIPVNTPACVPDCSVEGVPSLIWRREGWDFLRDIAAKHNLLIEQDPSKERLKEVVTTLLTDQAAYTKYIKDLQHVFRFHTEPEVLKCFEHIVESVF